MYAALAEVKLLVSITVADYFGGNLLPVDMAASNGTRKIDAFTAFHMTAPALVPIIVRTQ